MTGSINIEIVPLSDGKLHAYYISHSDGLTAAEALTALESATTIIQYGRFVDAKQKGFIGDGAKTDSGIFHHENVLLETILPHTITNLENINPATP